LKHNRRELKKDSHLLGVTTTAFVHLRETDTQTGTTITEVQNSSISPLEVARVPCSNLYYFVVSPYKIVVNSKHSSSYTKKKMERKRKKENFIFFK
jgi:hypothetical protein